MPTTVKASAMLLVIATTAAWSALPAGATPAATAPAVQGTIAAVSGDSITVTTADGSQKVAKVAPDTLILRREPAALRAIKAGDALAVTAARGADGSLTAVSISILSPELWNRARKGQWTMESGNIMTNAPVAQVVERVEGRTLHMKLDQGTGTISVPNATEIHRLTTVGLNALTPGMRVTVRGTEEPDGTTRASSILFDRPG
ncbi:MAG TPA: DUF5666 domain-containing protein [bacterium]|nr:DUF5666 domain-containing protein [bacterium]